MSGILCIFTYISILQLITIQFQSHDIEVQSAHNVVQLQTVYVLTDVDETTEKVYKAD